VSDGQEEAEVEATAPAAVKRSFQEAEAVKSFDAKTLIAVLVVTGSFCLLGIYVVQNRTPDQLVGYVIAGALSYVLGFFFGQHNGVLSGQLQASSQLAQALIAQMQQMSAPPPAPLPAKVTTIIEPPAAGVAA